MQFRTLRRCAPLLASLTILAGCADNPPIPLAGPVDLPRFMGDWYVLAAIPTFIETSSFNAVESYALNPDGTIATTFRFNEGAPDGPPKTYTPTGFVRPDSGNALWGMQFVWPIESEYRIAHLDAGYTQTIIARTARDYVWIMARSPSIGDAEYASLVAKVKEMGYDTGKLRRVPHKETARP